MAAAAMAAVPARARGATTALGSPVSGTAGPVFFAVFTPESSLAGVTDGAEPAGVRSGVGAGLATFLKCATA